MSVPSQVVLFGETLGLILGDADHRLEQAGLGRLSIAGCESNVAIALARLGQSCRFFSAVGNDPFGQRVHKVLRAEGVGDRDLVTRETGRTGLLLRNGFPWREPDVFYYRDQSAFQLSVQELAARVHLGPDDFFFTSGVTMALSQECADVVAGLLARSGEAGARVVMDANYRSKLWGEAEFRATLTPQLDKIHTLCLGLDEGKVLTGASVPAQIAKACLKAGVSTVVVKGGAGGAWYFDQNGVNEHSPAFLVENLVDPIGAGDAFDAGFLAAWMDGLPPAEQLRWGCALGALACMAYGDWEAAPTRDQLAQYLSGDRRCRR